MITITILGIDPYLLRDVSKDLTSKLAELYEVEEDDINFFAPEGLLAHNGVEQNTWNIIVRVHAPLKVQVLQEDAAEVIHNYIMNLCVQSAIEFYYYHEDDRYEFINENSERYMTEDNSNYVETDDEDEGDEENEEESKDEDIYLGNAFADFDKRTGNE